MVHNIGLKFGSIGLWVHPDVQTINNFLILEENSEFKKNLELKLKTELDLVNFESITNAQFDNIILTTNPQVICEYLDLDWKSWITGFESKQQIFEWICMSKYFKVDLFKTLNSV